MSRHRIGSRHGPPIVFLSLVVAAAQLVNTRTMLGRWSTAVPYNIDNRFQAWVIHWVQGALSGEHAFYDASTFAPASGALTFSDHLIGLALPLMPLRWLGLSPAAIFNTGVLLGAVTSACAGYVLGYVLTQRRAAAVVAGAVYSLGPLSYYTTLHINLVWRAGLPLVVAVVWVLADRSGSRRPWRSLPGDRTLLAVLAVTVAWQGLVSVFYVWSLLAILAVCIAVRWHDLASRRSSLLIAVMAGTLASALSYLPYLQTRSRYADFQWDFEDGIVRATLHSVEYGNTIWGGLLGTPLFNAAGMPSFPGVTVTLLVACGLVMWASRGRPPHAVPLLGSTLLVLGVILALGPGSGWWRDWTPYAIAFRFVPGFSAIRASGRFVLTALVGASVLAAMTVAKVLAWWERRQPARRPPIRASAVVGAVTVLALWAEGYNSGRAVTPAVTRPIDVRLAEERETGGVVYLPVGFDSLGEFENQETFVYRSTAHDRRIVNGYAGYYPPSAQIIADRLATLPAQAALDCLTAFDIRFVVVTDRVQLTPWSALTEPSQARPLELVAKFGDELLYRVPDRTVASDACALPGVDDED